MNNQPSLFEIFAEATRPLPAEFFNSIHLSGAELKRAKKKNKEQDERVLQIFKEFKRMTPLYCYRVYKERHPEAPETSIRRSINTLTSLGYLKMLDKSFQVMESFGKPNNQWEVV